VRHREKGKRFPANEVVEGPGVFLPSETVSQVSLTDSRAFLGLKTDHLHLKQVSSWLFYFSHPPPWLCGRYNVSWSGQKVTKLPSGAMRKHEELGAGPVGPGSVGGTGGIATGRMLEWFRRFYPQG
jgi:hypothetical protein